MEYVLPSVNEESDQTSDLDKLWFCIVIFVFSY